LPRAICAASFGCYKHPGEGETADLISIYNGRSRSLGEPERKDAFLQLSVAFRRYLYLFKGARLHVFMSISLHVDELGWSWPKVSTICKEARYGENAVQKALKELCTLKIRGKRVMLRAKDAPAHYVPSPKEKNYVRNFYLLFPDDAEIARFEGDGPEQQADPNHTPKKRVAFYGVGKRESLFVGPEKDSRSLNTKEEPGIKKNQKEEAEPKTHTQPEPAPSLFAQAETQGVVCVSEELRFEDYLGYARSQSSFTAPEAWARTHYPLRDEADEFLVREWKAMQTPEAIEEARTTIPNQNLFFSEAAQILRGILDVRPDSDVLKEIERMPLDEDVRARLVEKFVASKQETTG
jgi:hypothetical protein